MKKGLTAYIYRSDYKCKLNAYDNMNQVTIIDPAIDPISEPTETTPEVRIVRRTIYGKPYIHAEPIEPGQYAFGGSFIFCSDSRVREINTYPIPLHDRQMNLEN